MGKEKAPVDSDYSGRSLGRPTPEELKASDPHSRPYELLAIELPDGREAVQGIDRRYYLRGRNGYPDLDRPVDPHTGEPITE